MPRNSDVRELLIHLRQKPDAGVKKSVAISADIVSKAHALDVPLNSATVQAGLLLLLGVVEKEARADA
jgi:hypothetical protein